MKRFLRIASAGLVLVGVIAAASAQAAGNTKPYTANVRVESAADPNTFRLSLTNDPKATQSVGSANFTPPANFTAGAITNVPSGWNVSVVNNTVEFRANSSSTALAKGATVFADVTMTIPAGALCTTAAWKVEARQSNDFSGTPGNFMTLGTSDLTPLGSFTFAPIGTTVGGVFVPQVRIPDNTFGVAVNAWDTCGFADVDYPGGATVSATPQIPTRLQNVTFSALGFSGGVGTGSANISQANVEAGDTITVTDSGPNGSGISAVSTSGGTAPNAQSKVVPQPNDPFDVVQTICTGSGSLCKWVNKNGSINANSTLPSDSGASLGFGFRGQDTISSTTCDNGSSALLGDVVDINPHHYTTAYQVTIIYSKSVTGNGSPSSFVFCISEDNTQTWTSLPMCTTTITTQCVVSEGRVPGGGLQFTLSLLPGDPWGGLG
jgi:hypothetical protein